MDLLTAVDLALRAIQLCFLSVQFLDLLFVGFHFPVYRFNKFLIHFEFPRWGQAKHWLAKLAPVPVWGPLGPLRGLELVLRVPGHFLVCLVFCLERILMLDELSFLFVYLVRLFINLEILIEPRSRLLGEDRPRLNLSHVTLLLGLPRKLDGGHALGSGVIQVKIFVGWLLSLWLRPWLKSQL